MIVHLRAVSLVGALFFAGCDDEGYCETCPGGPTSSSSSSSGTTSSGTTSSTSTGSSCTMTTGFLVGTVGLFEPTGGPNHVDAPYALVQLRRAPEDEPLNAMANDVSRYEVELQPGMWIVGGESADGYCTTFLPETVLVEVCDTTDHELVLEACVN
jgi:hypothetical protein